MEMNSNDLLVYFNKSGWVSFSWLWDMYIKSNEGWPCPLFKNLQPTYAPHYCDFLYQITILELSCARTVIGFGLKEFCGRGNILILSIYNTNLLIVPRNMWNRFHPDILIFTHIFTKLTQLKYAQKKLHKTC